LNPLFLAILTREIIRPSLENGPALTSVTRPQGGEMTPSFASNRLDWSSAVGLFIITCGTLDYRIAEGPTAHTLVP
jgi:hypothetical protein